MQIGFNVSFKPWWKRRHIEFFAKSWKLSETKGLDISVNQWSRSFNVIGCELEITSKQDHAGVHFSADLLGYNFEIEYYDIRHWDSVNNCWEKHDA